MEELMNCRKTNVLLLVLFGCLWFFAPAPGVIAQEAAPEAAARSAEIESIIKTLEDPGAREELIRQLQILSQARPEEQAASEVKSAASQTLRDISRRLNSVTESVVVLTGNINQIPEILGWFKNELTDPQSRQRWIDILINITLTMGLGYLGFFLVRWGLFRFRRAVAEKPVEHSLSKTFRLLGILVLDLLPIFVFALVAYLTLGLVGPLEKTRLVALAWINAFIIVHGLLALFHLIFAPSAPILRCSELSDETANYLVIWGKRLGYTSIYGYFTLQAALLLGLPQPSYEVLLRLLGLLVAVLVIVIILQNREEVTAFVQQWPNRQEGQAARGPLSRGVRIRLAQVWHLLAIFYVIVLFGVWGFQIDRGFFFLMRATLLTLVVLVVLRGLLRLLATLFNRGFRIKDELKSRYPGLDERANRYLHTLRRVLNVVVYFLAAMSILQAWGINSFGWLISEPGQVLGGTLVAVFGILLTAFLIWEIVNSVIEGHLTRKDDQGLNHEASARTRTLLAVARKALAIVLTVVASLMVLSRLGVDTAPLLAGAGVLGLAVGFGSQKLVQDVITGVFILLEDQIAVGDVVNLGDKGGVVEAVSIRTVRLRDLTGTVHTIPFSAISIVSNLTKDFSYYVMEVGIAYREDVDEVMQVLRDIGTELQLDAEYGPKILEPLDVLGVDAFADSAVVIKARIKTVPIKQWWVGREFNRRMKKRFDELGIEIPFPHTTIYFGENKGGGAPPAYMQVESVSGNQPKALVPEPQPQPGGAKAD
jgi:small conductance mechanosensitive channel